MPLLSDLGKHTKDDPALSAALPTPLEEQLRASAATLRARPPTTALHKRVQALIDTSRAGSANVAAAVEQSSAKVEVLGSKLEGIASGLATVFGGKLLELETRVGKLETGKLQAPGGTPGQSQIPPVASLTEAQLICLRAITQIDAQLLDKDMDVEELSRHLKTKSSDGLGREALRLLTTIQQQDAWNDLCQPVTDLNEVPRRIWGSQHLREIVLQTTELRDSVATAG